MQDLKKIVVIGAGTMGHGIAQVAARCGLESVLHDVSSPALATGMAAVEKNLDQGVEKGKVTIEEREQTLSRLSGEPDLDRALDRVSMVIEAVPEHLDLKKSIFKDLDTRLPADIVIATNTSSLPIAELARATRRPQLVIGMHFFNPVHIMKLLEVVRGEATSDACLDLALSLGVRMGKECIVVRDSPGFATSRLGLVLGLEAIRMVEEEVASAADIDKAMTLGYRHPVGPLRLTDLVGLDVRLAIAKHLHTTLGSSAFSPPALLETMVAEGKLGQKTGRGFYEWS